MFENITPAPEERHPGEPASADPGPGPLPPAPSGADAEAVPREETGWSDAFPSNEEDADSDSNRDAALDQWKHALRRDFEYWLESIDEIPSSGENRETLAEAPDLYSFYEQLTAANAEVRKSNRRTAEAFSQWMGILSKFDSDLRSLREQLARQPVSSEDTLPRPWCMALVELIDRLHRLAAAFSRPPAKSWWGRDARWRTAWQTQQQGFDILLGHFDDLLKKAGITTILTLHQPFDPAIMAAVATVPNTQWPEGTVVEEVAAGYRLRGELLRIAQVRLASPPRRNDE